MRRSKSASFIGMIGGAVFILIGLSFFGFNGFNPFSLIFILFAVLITGGHAFNFFSRRGLAEWEVDFEATPKERAADDFEERMRKLAGLHKDGIITDEEFERKRKEILDDKW